MKKIATGLTELAYEKLCQSDIDMLLPIFPCELFPSSMGDELFLIKELPKNDQDVHKDFLIIKEEKEKNPLLSELKRQKISEEEFIEWLKSEGLFRALRFASKNPSTVGVDELEWKERGDEDILTFSKRLKEYDEQFK